MAISKKRKKKSLRSGKSSGVLGATADPNLHMLKPPQILSRPGVCRGVSVSC